MTVVLEGPCDVPPIEFPTRCTGSPTTSIIKSRSRSAHTSSVYMMFGFSDFPKPSSVIAQTLFPDSAMGYILSL